MTPTLPEPIISTFFSGKDTVDIDEGFGPQPAVITPGRVQPGKLNAFSVAPRGQYERGCVDRIGTGTVLHGPHFQALLYADNLRFQSDVDAEVQGFGEELPAYIEASHPPPCARGSRKICVSA